MKITIITVAKNAAETIEKCILSVIEQDYEDIEHIIVDGNSSDNTLNSINSINGKRLFTLISEPDKGMYEAINKGILRSTGEIIALLHADDYFANKHIISNIVKHFTENKVDILFAKVAFVHPKTNQITRIYSSNFFKPWMFRFGFSPAHPTFYAKKELFLKYGLYQTDYRIAGDFELMMRFLYIHKIAYQYINECWVYMRLGGLSTAGYKSLIKMNEEIIAACKHNQIYSNKLFIYSKYLFKWWGFVFKNESKTAIS